MRPWIHFVLALCAATTPFVVSQAAVAGTIFTLEQTKQDGTVIPSTMYVDTDKFRMSSPAGDFVFRGDLNKIWVLQSKDRSYRELTPASLSEAAARRDLAISQMKEKLASLPESQRKQVEALMAARGLSLDKSAPVLETTYEKNGPSRKIGDWDCLPYRVSAGSKLVSDLCVAKLSDLGLTRPDLDVFASLRAFLSQMQSVQGVGVRSSMPTMDIDGLTKAIGFEGLPIETTNAYRDENHKIVTTLKTISHQDAPTGTFDLPAGYTKVDMGHASGAN